MQNYYNKSERIFAKLINIIGWTITATVILITLMQCTMTINQNVNINHHRWTTKTEYIDGETGEQITPHKFKKGNYIIIQTIKLPTNHESREKRIRKICRTNNQTTLEFK
ncbi:MAG: hypothetical protein [Microviridae sp.]|nr:MAG: hypothetical protein [Microviridae sp.]